MRLTNACESFLSDVCERHACLLCAKTIASVKTLTLTRAADLVILWSATVEDLIDGHCILWCPHLGQLQFEDQLCRSA